MQDEFVLLMSMTEGDEEQETAEVPGAGGAAGDDAEGDGDEAASGDDSGQARPPSVSPVTTLQPGMSVSVPTTRHAALAGGHVHC
jgi:hypothetical protein